MTQVEEANVSAADERPTTELGNCLVTGGAGFLGSHLAKELLKRGFQVRVFDRAPLDYSHDNLDFVQGDLTNLDDVIKACQGIDTVFHTAAVLCLETFATKKQRDAAYAINVGGVEKVVSAAKQTGVKRLIHTSSNNATLHGPVVNGDDTTPYAVTATDLYTMTKIAGEKVALAGNGNGGLLTAVVRPGGIWGVGEQLFLPRTMEKIVKGQLIAIIGDGSAMSENSLIENLVDGHIAVGRHLVPGTPVCGGIYYITDDSPMNYFEFFRPLMDAVGKKYPTMHIPVGPFKVMAVILEFLHWAFKFPAPPFNILELRKITVTHYNSIDKARRDLGWEPPFSQEEAYEKVMPYCIELADAVEVVDQPHWGWWVSIIGGMVALAVIAFNPGAYACWSENITTLTPRWLLQGVFYVAALLHIYKGMKAVRMAEQAGLSKSSMGWGWQTFILGFASLGLLEKKAASMKVED